MLQFVFKPKGSRVFRGRYRIGDNPQIFDVALHTDKRHVAEAELRQLVIAPVSGEASIVKVEAKGTTLTTRSEP
jgi:hypothetical protein